VLAFAAVPLIISSCKPVAKKVGEKLVEWGEKLRKDSEEVEAPPVVAEPSSNATVKEDVSAQTVKTASPTGKDEVKAQVASKTAKAKAPPKAAKPAAAKKKAAPKAKPGTATNPKKSG
jgi:hypothetical protein